MEMGKIEVRLFAYLRDLHPEAKKEGVLVMPLDKRTDVGDLIASLNLPGKEISLVMVNGKHQRDDYILKDGDRVGIFPMIGGG
jgi:molybdopterin converting factor small subunit